ncbi:HupE/UreJ family protein [Neptunicella sp. SCSIO 80796]|uniref:HupE/UreJ family protein n=1 Tax=Neptunicella plasticusilytica TaxID=3117012 RepID=UPI003A4E28BF
MRRLIKGWLLGVLITGLFANIVMADEIRPAFLSLLEQTNHQYQVNFKVPLHNGTRLSLQAQFPAHCAAISAPSVQQDELISNQRWQIQCQHSLAGQSLQIKSLNNTRTDVLLRVEFADGSLDMQRFTPAQTQLQIAKPDSRLSIAASYTHMGIEHILIGWDHLLFVLCLVFIAGSLKRIILTITGFTLAHSVTLLATSLNWVQVPIAPVEAVIALSILFLACELLRADKTSLTWRYPALVSSTFGLIHGFGFAAVLTEIGLPQNGFATALLFFNLGVELGQLIFIGSLLLLAWIVRQFCTIKRQDLLHTTAYTVGTVSAFWLVERTVSFF